jgi:hypothetical protein
MAIGASYEDETIGLMSEALETAHQLIYAKTQIHDLRKALTIVKAERDHWHGLVPRADRVQFPFDPSVMKD